jgi:hypothetical protein
MTHIGKQRWMMAAILLAAILDFVRNKIVMQDVMTLSLQVLAKFVVDSSSRLEFMTHIGKQDGCWRPSWI